MKEKKEQARIEETKRRREDNAAVNRSRREAEKERHEAGKEARRDAAVANRIARERRKSLGYTYYRGSYRRY